MVWADTLARTLFDPREIPVGIITALLGAPVFIVMLWHRRSAP
jgi:iron complex transport system permease protein